MASEMGFVAQRMVVTSSVAIVMFGGTVAEVIDESDGDGAIWTKRPCLGGIWVRGECVGERRGQGRSAATGR
jgi:hypothetical protein